jgi:hypothetical protein
VRWSNTQHTEQLKDDAQTAFFTMNLHDDFILVESFDHALPGNFYISKYPIIDSGHGLLKSTLAEAINYCHQLSAKNHLKSAYNPETWIFSEPPDAAEFSRTSGFRLPTPQEWEYAAKGWSGRRCGRYLEIQKNYFKVPGLDYPITPQEIQTYQHGYSTTEELVANEIGIYGMLGHAREWCNISVAGGIQKSHIIHWDEYILNYDNDTGYCVTLEPSAENVRHSFRVVLEKN